MSETDERRGLILFGGLTVLILVLSLTAYFVSGHMGIEERFNNAVGIHGDSEEEEASGLFGFNIEGNLLYYAVILTALIILCLIAYIKWRKM